MEDKILPLNALVCIEKEKEQQIDATPAAVLKGRIPIKVICIICDRQDLHRKLILSHLK